MSGVFRGLRPLLWVAACLAANASVPAFSATPVAWTEGAGGAWSMPSGWSLNLVPNNGAPTAGDTYEVLLGDLGAAYTVGLDTAVEVDRITLDASATLDLLAGGTLSVVDELDLGDGTLRLLGGTLKNTRVTGTANGVITSIYQSPRVATVFDHVTLSVDAWFDAGGPLEIRNGLTLEQSTIGYTHGFTGPAFRFVGD